MFMPALKMGLIYLVMYLPIIRTFVVHTFIEDLLY